MKQRETIPAGVIRQLRQEVGYGCPICRSPFLTFHHFDPPYHIEPHNRPEGMIALCREHHDEADSGHYSKNELRQLKLSQNNVDDVLGAFPSWKKPNLLIRLAGFYVMGTGFRLSLGGETVVLISRTESNMLSLSFTAKGEQGETLVRMVDNIFEACPDNIHDLQCAAKKSRVRLWLKQRDIGLELTFQRMEFTKLNDIILGDAKRTRNQLLQNLELKASDLPNSEFERLRIEWQKDLTGDGIRKWIKERGRDDEGLTPFINLERIAVFHHGLRCDFQDGIAGLSFGSLTREVETSEQSSQPVSLDIECGCLACFLNPQDPLPAESVFGDVYQATTEDFE
ncbi:MAG: hypothetical protein R3C18_17340 [Planctomycetaceae bacterium]